MSVYLTIASIILGILALLSFATAIFAFKRRKIAGATFNLLLAIIFLLTGLFTGTLSVSIQGYNALTRENVAAIVQTESLGSQSFRATFYFKNGDSESFQLAGDELYVDAHILKWKPFVNIIGIHTLYELDRVAGRYTALQAEQTQPRTVYSLARDKPIDLFHLRRQYPFLAPLADAEYGSATFVTARDSAVFELRVSTTGLLIREIS